jgi:hypothetical protein
MGEAIYKFKKLPLEEREATRRELKESTTGKPYTEPVKPRVPELLAAAAGPCGVPRSSVVHGLLI